MTASRDPEPTPAQAAAFVRQHFAEAGPPGRVGLVLGSGLGGVVEALEDRHSVAYGSVPGMPGVGVAGHGGKLWIGTLAAVPVVCLEGRAHAYEGHPTERVVFGVRLLAELGCQVVILSNAAGSINLDYRVGDVMLISDHLNLTGRNPLVGPRHDPWPRFVDMSDAYDSELRTLAHEAAAQSQLTLRDGVYAGLLGPNYETPAEIRMLRSLGADTVGMSTVLEVIALRQRGVRVAALSCVTNLAAGVGADALSHADVERAGAALQSRLSLFLPRWVVQIQRRLGA